MLRYKTNEPFQKIKKPFPLFLILGVEFKVNSFIQPVHTHTQKKQHFLYKKKNNTLMRKENYIANYGNQQCTMAESIKKLCDYQIKMLPELFGQQCRKPIKITH